MTDGRASENEEADKAEMDEPGAAPVKPARSDTSTEVHFFFSKCGRRGRKAGPSAASEVKGQRSSGAHPECLRWL